MTRLIEKRSDDELARLMNNLGGHDLPSLLEAFGKIDHDRPICFICYTIKGFGLPFAGHKDNHAGLMTPAQMETLPQRDERAAGPRMGPVRGPAAAAPSTLQAFLDQRAVRRRRPRRLTRAAASRCRTQLAGHRSSR